MIDKYKQVDFLERTSWKVVQNIKEGDHNVILLISLLESFHLKILLPA